MANIRRVVVVLLLVIGVVAAGCGDDDADPVEASDSSAATDTGDTGDADDTDAGEPVALPEDPCSLVTDEEVEELIGPSATEEESGTAIDGATYAECVWETETHGPKIGVAVVEGPERYEQRVGFVEDGTTPDGELLDDLGDGAVVAPGVSLETSGATGGRTATVLVGDQTVAVALKLDGETSTDDVVALTETVLGRL